MKKISTYTTLENIKPSLKEMSRFISKSAIMHQVI